MSVYVTFECDGCFAKAAHVDVRQEFISISGRGYGFGRYHTPSIKDVCPADWLAYDSIGATYCPACAAELFDEVAETASDTP